MVLLQGMSLAIVGVAIGTACAFALSRLIASLLFGVTAAIRWSSSQCRRC